MRGVVTLFHVSWSNGGNNGIFPAVPRVSGSSSFFSFFKYLSEPRLQDRSSGPVPCSQAAGPCWHSTSLVPDYLSFNGRPFSATEGNLAFFPLATATVQLLERGGCVGGGGGGWWGGRGVSVLCSKVVRAWVGGAQPGVCGRGRGLGGGWKFWGGGWGLGGGFLGVGWGGGMFFWGFLGGFWGLGGEMGFGGWGGLFRGVSFLFLGFFLGGWVFVF